jgi:hypothetical protein
MNKINIFSSRNLMWHLQTRDTQTIKPTLVNLKLDLSKPKETNEILWQNLLKYNFRSNILFSDFKPPDSSMFEMSAAWSEMDRHELFVPEAFSPTIQISQIIFRDIVVSTLENFNFYSKYPFSRFAQKNSDKSRGCTVLVPYLAYNNNDRTRSMERNFFCLKHLNQFQHVRDVSTWLWEHSFVFPLSKFTFIGTHKKFLSQVFLHKNGNEMSMFEPLASQASENSRFWLPGYLSKRPPNRTWRCIQPTRTWRCASNIGWTSFSSR